MDEILIDLVAQVELNENDNEELQRYTHQLKTELSEVCFTEPVKSSTKVEGAKGVDPAIIGALSIAVATYALPKLFEVLQSWVLRDRGRTVKIKFDKIEIEFTSDKPLSPEEIIKLVDRLNVSEKKKRREN